MGKRARISLHTHCWVLPPKFAQLRLGAGDAHVHELAFVAPGAHAAQEERAHRSLHLFQGLGAARLALGFSHSGFPHTQQLLRRRGGAVVGARLARGVAVANVHPAPGHALVLQQLPQLLRWREGAGFLVACSTSCEHGLSRCSGSFAGSLAFNLLLLFPCDFSTTPGRRRDFGFCARLPGKSCPVSGWAEASFLSAHVFSKHIAQYVL
mmetsp:Transcript_38142/g.73154  ORF Transcript_38142/g.73154 Transcript_38142/m.73154 type:complete len:209 (+) Transcript_38142:524-1150(+)